MSQKEFSVLTGIDPYQISKIVNNKLRMSIDHVNKIRSVFSDFDPQLVRDIPDFTENITGDQIPVYNVKVFGTISPVFDDNEILLPLAIKRFGSKIFNIFHVSYFVFAKLTYFFIIL